jgi:hypothetical protein
MLGNIDIYNRELAGFQLTPCLLFITCLSRYLPESAGVD